MSQRDIQGYSIADDHGAWVELANLVEWMDAYLDGGVDGRYMAEPLAQDWARVAKASEEVGEAIDALIGVSGQNPRKGHYGDMSDLLAELADVALTGLYAIQHFTKAPDVTMSVLLKRARRHYDRVQGLPSNGRFPEGAQ